MSKKRFTDIEIWDREWFMELAPKMKCLVRYLFDKCDASGIWKPNWKLASLHIGEAVSLIDLKLIPGDQYEIIGGKIFLPDFIDFQYGKLSEACPAHKPIFRAIERNKLEDRVFSRVSSTLQEKEEDKEEEKDKDFGKSENLLVPEMSAQFKKHHPKYPLDQKTDFPALFEIATKIKNWENMDGVITDQKNREKIKLRWGEIIVHTAADGHLSKYSISQINKHFQSVIHSQNGTNSKTSTSGGKLGASAVANKATREY